MATTKNITMKQFNGTDYDTLYPKTVYNQVSGVAPAGYGLGGIGKRVTDMNNAQESGFYSALGASNLPPNVESVQYGSVLVLCSQQDRVTQVYFQDVTNGDGAIAVRRLNGNGWSQWEFINPPMKLGVEYRTTERYQGKPVYAKCVNFGSLPNSGQKQVKYTEKSGCHVISISGNAIGGNNNFTIPSSDILIVKAYANSDGVFLKTEEDLSAWTAYVFVKYTKE